MDDLERLTKERDELQAELLRWQRLFAGHVYVPNEEYVALARQRLFAGHVYVPNEEYVALAKKARDAEARVRKLESNQRTPGTVEVCRYCGDEADGYRRNCTKGKCPLRSVSPSP